MLAWPEISQVKKRRWGSCLNVTFTSGNGTQADVDDGDNQTENSFPILNF